MTGKEKIQAFIDLIDEVHKELIVGNTITIESYMPEKKGITLEEQAQILEILSDDYQIIKYTAHKNYDSIDDIPEDEKVALREVEAMTVYPLDFLLEEAAKQITYTIEILKNFNSYTNTDKHSTDNSQVDVNNIAKLTLTGKISKLTFNGTTYTLHKFRSKSDGNYIVFKSLMAQPDKPLTKEELGAPKMSTKVKDIPKTMGFKSELKDIFFSVDSESQTLMLHPKKSLTEEEVVVILDLVNSKKAEN